MSGSTTMKRAYRFRFYPTSEQEQVLARTFGCVRVVWNQILDRRTMRWRTEGVSTTYAESDKMLTALKREESFAFLNEVSSVPLQQVLRHQHKAMTNFFEKRSRYPRYKTRKRRKDSATYTVRGFSWKPEIRELKLAKMSEPLKIAWSQDLPEGAVPSTVTVSLDKAGRYHVSILIEETIPHLPKTSGVVGLDVGVSTWVSTSAGEKINLPESLGRAHRKTIKAQKELSRKDKGSTRAHRARKRLARAWAREADIRKDFLHKQSTRIIRDNQTVVLEDLNVQAMTASSRGTIQHPGKRVRQKAGLNRAILDGAWGELRAMIEYKAAWYGRDIVVADRFYPSTKTCSTCGHLLDHLPLSKREWDCPACGSHHDRDLNAATNLAAFALGLREKQNARGGPVRPTSTTLAGKGR